MKLVCMAQMFCENTHKGWDGKTNLHRFMESISTYCDGLVMYDDESFDNGVDLVRAYEDYFEDLELIEGKKNDFVNELAHKQMCLDKCREMGADYILWLDVDEVVEAEAERAGIRALCDEMEDGAPYGAVNFFQKNLWRTDRYHRTDELWDQGLFCRLWRLTDALHYDVKPGLHQDLAPKGIIKRATTHLKVIHYGFSSSDNVLRKYYMYKRNGQKGRPLARLIDESSLRIKESNPEWFLEGQHGPGKEVYNTPLKAML